jgi:chemotaxis protein CheY-P-specific phosphatase CheC
MDVDVVVLSEMERDALAELANMGVNRAAARLGQMLGDQVICPFPPLQSSHARALPSSWKKVLRRH